ncbi:unnamed protein product [Lactuca saligna]|uniref:Glycine-rich protein n=1 Tax=Lactuca saligna TaxID=75948 RepID=A0AA35VN58_LACSI|nr:unnamed protein product [Lactuca saligna]
MASGTATSDVTDGPVLTLINKRIRNLRKKLNRIAQLEDSIAQGKSIIKNKEQEELLKSKPAIIAAVDELEKFRQPLSVAIDEEISLALQRRHVTASEDNDNDDDSNKAQTLDKEQQETEPPALAVDDLLSLIYFGSMFEVKSQNDFNSIMLTRSHERNCCLTYDYVTDDDAAVMLGERDLDLISTMGSLLISRPVDSSLSHQDALQRCVEHAKLWLSKSEQQIDSNSNVTYADLREKLAKIMGSDYFKITPEMKAPADVAAEAAGNYSFQVPVQVEASVTRYEQKEEDVTDHQRSETYEDQSAPIENSHKDETEAENSIEVPVQEEPTELQAGGEDNKDQHVNRRPYQNQRGGGGGGGGRGGGRRGYSNGRGGRSGGRGGPYQNGRNNYYEQQPGNYYPRNYNGGGGRGRGGGGRGNFGNSYNHHVNASGVEAAES